MSGITASGGREQLTDCREEVPHCSLLTEWLSSVCLPTLTDLCFAVNNRQCLCDSQTVAVRVTTGEYEACAFWPNRRIWSWGPRLL